MLRTASHEIPVLVVGAGPAGLAAAITLARNGVETVVIDRRTAPSGLPRAASVSTRTMELIRSWGLEQEVRDGGVDVEWRQWVGRTLLDHGDVRATSYPTREQSLVLGPAAPASVPQDHLEPVLLAHLRSLPGAAVESAVESRVELGVELVELDSGPDGVRAVVREAGSGRHRTLHARYVVAADGVRSAVRRALGIGASGQVNLSSAVGTIFRAPLAERLGPTLYQLYATTHPEAAGVFIPAGPGDRWTYGVEFEHGRVPLADFTEAHVVDRLRTATGIVDLQPRIERIGAFTFAAQLADRFRCGSTFLVGDAAHQVTPRGGTGLNTAVQGAHDLAWKLAWVLRGWAAPALLDSYEREFRPAAAHNVARSADPAGGARQVGEELIVDLGARLPHVWLPVPGGRVSTLDLLGPGLTLFTGPAGATWEAAAASLPVPIPVGVHHLDAVSARGMGIGPGGALLARPDGAPAGWWPCDRQAEASLRDAVDALVRADAPRDPTPLLQEIRG